MPTFKTFLLRQPCRRTFASIPLAHEFLTAAYNRIGRLKEYKREWRSKAKAQFLREPQNVKAQRSFASLGAMVARSPSIRSFRDNEKRWMDKLEDVREAFGEKEVVHGRMPGDLNDVKIMHDVLARYHAAAGPRSKSIDKEILGCLIIDIYTASAQFMRRVIRSDHRTDQACILFQLFRNLNIAAEKDFAAVFEGQQIELYIQQQNIAMAHHGVHLDETMFKDTQQNIKYFKDAQALGFRLEISGGKIHQRDTRRPGEFKLVDTTSREYREGNPCYSVTDHSRHESSKDGVTGFAMLSNRQIYATMHSDDPTAGSVYHSAYSAGNEILCSGTLGIKQGVLTYIDNLSGHYKPGFEQLSLCIQSLRTSGVDIKNLTICAFAKNWRDDKKFINAVKFIEEVKGTLASNAQGRYRATAARIREAVRIYEQRQAGASSAYGATAAKIREAVRIYKQRHTGLSSIFRHPSSQTRDAIQRLEFIIQNQNNEALVRAVEVLIGWTHEFQNGISAPQEIAVPAPDITDDTADSTGAAVGTAFAPLATLPDRPDKWNSKDRGPGELKTLLIDAMKDYLPVRHQTPQTMDAIQRLRFLIRTRNDEGLVRTVEVLIGRTHEFEDGKSDPQVIAVPAPDVTDDTADSTGAAVGTAFAPLKALPDRRDRLYAKHLGPVGLKELLIDAMKDYKPV